MKNGDIHHGDISLPEGITTNHGMSVTSDICHVVISDSLTSIIQFAVPPVGDSSIDAQFTQGEFYGL